MILRDGMQYKGSGPPPVKCPKSATTLCEAASVPRASTTVRTHAPRARLLADLRPLTIVGDVDGGAVIDDLEIGRLQAGQ